MKKLFFVLCSVLLTLTSCSKDDSLQITKSDIVGTWNVTAYAIGGNDFQNIGKGNIYINVFDNDSYTIKFLQNYYVGTYKIDGDTMIGTTLDPITEYFKFEELLDNTALISYTNSEGDKYKFRAQKN